MVRRSPRRVLPTLAFVGSVDAKVRPDKRYRDFSRALYRGLFVDGARHTVFQGDYR
jgi:hypothetical protein